MSFVRFTIVHCNLKSNERHLRVVNYKHWKRSSIKWNGSATFTKSRARIIVQSVACFPTCRSLFLRCKKHVSFAYFTLVLVPTCPPQAVRSKRNSRRKSRKNGRRNCGHARPHGTPRRTRWRRVTRMSCRTCSANSPPRKTSLARYVLAAVYIRKTVLLRHWFCLPPRKTNLARYVLAAENRAIVCHGDLIHFSWCRRMSFYCFESATCEPYYSSSCTSLLYCFAAQLVLLVYRRNVFASNCARCGIIFHKQWKYPTLYLVPVPQVLIWRTW